MRDKTDRYTVHTISTFSPKRLGSYLLEAGLLTADQITVVLNDQQATGMRFGDIVVARGWLKEQTIEWIVTKVVEPERQINQRRQPVPQPQTNPPRPVEAVPTPLAFDTQSKKPPMRRDLPISKPLPPVQSPDGDVKWVG